jgi:hypothetical protein
MLPWACALCASLSSRAEASGVGFSVKLGAGGPAHASEADGKLRVFEGAGPEGSDHVVRESASAYEDFLLFRRKPDVERARYSLDSKELAFRLDEGGVAGVDRLGTARTWMRPPWVIDGKGRMGWADVTLSCEPSTFSHCELALDWSKGHWQYPIVVDPHWSEMAPLQVPRMWHTATLLPKKFPGQVLVMGGRGEFPTPVPATSSVELYDVSANKWRECPPLATARVYHTATWLDDVAKVLVVGGYDEEGTALDSYELYDPDFCASGVGPAKPAPKLTGPRAEHTATLIDASADGAARSTRVLVAGGGDARPEIYDSATGTWRPLTASMPGGTRYGHTATFLPAAQPGSGTILFVGGGTGPLLSGDSLDTCVAYSIASDSFLAVPGMDTVRPPHAHTASLVDGKVLVIGAAGASKPSLFDPSAPANPWTDLAAPMRGVFTYHAAADPTLLPGFHGALVIGGQVAGQANAETAFFDARSAEWDSLSFTLNLARFAHTVTPIDGGRALLAIGGTPNAAAAPFDSVERVDLRPNGDPCLASSNCLSDHCVDGVCCRSACEGGETDCQACSIAAGGSMNGECTTRSAGSSCGPSTSCAASARCDGQSRICPPSPLEQDACPPITPPITPPLKPPPPVTSDKTLLSCAVSRAHGGRTACSVLGVALALWLGRRRTSRRRVGLASLGMVALLSSGCSDLANIDDGGFGGRGGTGGGAGGGGGIDAAVPEDSADGLGGASCDGSTSRVLEGTWSSWSPPTDAPRHPSGRFLHAMAASGDARFVLMFGGASVLGGGLGDTWSFMPSTSTWQPLSEVTAPTLRGGHALSAADKGESFLLFGGEGTAVLGDTWVWSDGGWRPRCGAPDGSSQCGPPARSRHAMAYDAARDQVVLFGGRNGNASFRDTWSFTLAGGWKELCTPRCPADGSPCCSPPDARAEHALAFDSVRSVIVLFGGKDEAGHVLGDTWEWNGEAWSMAHPLLSPDARSNHAMSGGADGVILYGGRKDAVISSDALWFWDGLDWIQAKSEGVAPTARPFGALAYDAPSKAAILFGGGLAGEYSDTWLLQLKLRVAPADPSCVDAADKDSNDAGGPTEASARTDADAPVSSEGSPDVSADH